jgi:hypothetical protein
LGGITVSNAQILSPNPSLVSELSEKDLDVSGVNFVGGSEANTILEGEILTLADNLPPSGQPLAEAMVRVEYFKYVNEAILAGAGVSQTVANSGPQLSNALVKHGEGYDIEALAIFNELVGLLEQ